MRVCTLFSLRPKDIIRIGFSIGNIGDGFFSVGSSNTLGTTWNCHKLPSFAFGATLKLQDTNNWRDDHLDLDQWLLGGSLPTNRLGGWTNPGYFHGISGGNVHLYLGWTNPLTKWDEPPSSVMEYCYSKRCPLGVQFSSRLLQTSIAVF